MRTTPTGYRNFRTSRPRRALRRHHRLPGVEPGRGSGRRPARHLRLRRFGAPGRPQWPSTRRSQRVRHDPLEGSPPGLALELGAQFSPARTSRHRRTAPCRSIRPSCSGRPAAGAGAAVPGGAPWTAGARWSVAGIHLSDFRRCTTGPSCSRNASCAACDRKYQDRRRRVPPHRGGNSAPPHHRALLAACRPGHGKDHRGSRGSAEATASTGGACGDRRMARVP